MPGFLFLSLLFIGIVRSTIWVGAAGFSPLTKAPVMTWALALGFSYKLQKRPRLKPKFFMVA